MAIRIPIIADVIQALRGTKDLEEAFDDVAGALDTIDSSSSGASGGIDDVSDAARDSKRDADNMERSFRDAFDGVRRESRSAGDDVSDNMSRGARDAGDSTAEFRDEARQNFGEVTSSFSGDMDSIADLAQGTFGGLAGSIAGPVGLAFGALAAGAGLFYSAWKENTEKTQQRVSDMYDDMVESGTDFLSKDFLTKQLADIYQGADDAIIKVAELRDLASTAEVSEPLLARALVGDEAAREELRTEISARRLQITQTLDEATASGGNMAPALAPAIQALQDIEDELNGTTEGFDTARSNADAARAAIEGIVAPTQGVASSADDAMSKFDGLGRKIETLPAVKVKVDTTEADATMRRFTTGWATLRVGVTVRPGSTQAV